MNGLYRRHIPRFLVRGVVVLALGAGFCRVGRFEAVAQPRPSEYPTGPQPALGLGVRPKYPPDFTHFDYANPHASKGGTLTLPEQGGFGTLNPFTLEGRPAYLISLLVFESLTDPSLDKPSTEYGLIARTMEVAQDELSVVYGMRPEARFSDGRPVTAEDVMYSFDVLRSAAAAPTYKFYYKDISAVEAIDPYTVRIRFSRVNRELPMITGDL